jgi:hypothetical protein
MTQGIIGFIQEIASTAIHLEGRMCGVLKAILLQGRIIGLLEYSFNDHLRRLRRKCGSVIAHAYVQILSCEIYITMYYQFISTRGMKWKLSLRKN